MFVGFRPAAASLLEGLPSSLSPISTALSAVRRAGRRYKSRLQFRVCAVCKTQASTARINAFALRSFCRAVTHVRADIFGGTSCEGDGLGRTTSSFLP
jgi:hypothetical protein